MRVGHCASAAAAAIGPLPTDVLADRFLSACRSFGVAVAAIVFSETGSSDPTTGENLAGLARCPEFQNDGAPELIQFPHLLPDDSGEEVFRAGIQRWVL